MRPFSHSFVPIYMLLLLRCDGDGNAVVQSITRHGEGDGRFFLLDLSPELI